MRVGGEPGTLVMSSTVLRAVRRGRGACGGRSVLGLRDEGRVVAAVGGVGRSGLSPRHTSILALVTGCTNFFTALIV